MLRISLPAGVDSVSLGICQLFFLRIVNQIGDIQSAAHGIALRWEGLGYLTGHAFSVAAMTLVGQNLGARRSGMAARSGWTALALGGLAMCFMGAVFALLAEPMFLLFCPRPEQAPIVGEGVPALRLIALAMPSAACCFILTGCLRGAGDTRVPILFTWLGFLGVRLPLALLFTQVLGLGLIWAWVAMSADLTVRGAAFLIRFYRGGWKRIEV
jgi:Na+-driven multidrug efflux pump